MPQHLFLQATAPENDAAPTPTSILVFAHPDDEVIALGARLGRFRAERLVHVTDGAPRNAADSRSHGFESVNEYRQVRRNELRNALSRAGFQTAAECLEIPDQEASLRLPALVRGLYDLFRETEPRVVFTHPYEGGHPDHDACAFAVHRAAALLDQEVWPGPLIVEGAFYHAGVRGIETGCFPPPADPPRQAMYPLSAGERRAKQALLDCFITQRETLRWFAVDCERFRIAPRYDFHQPPNGGRVFYESFPWGMTSDRFCQLAAEADEALAMETIGRCV